MLFLEKALVWTWGDRVTFSTSQWQGKFHYFDERNAVSLGMQSLDEDL
jgi:predicted sulfurtransferase